MVKMGKYRKEFWQANCCSVFCMISICMDRHRLPQKCEWSACVHAPGGWDQAVFPWFLLQEHYVAMETASRAAEHADGCSLAFPNSPVSFSSLTWNSQKLHLLKFCQRPFVLNNWKITVFANLHIMHSKCKSLLWFVDVHKQELN